MKESGKFFAVALALVALAVRGGAQEPLNPPAPLLSKAAGQSLGQNTMALEAATRAHNLGQASIAADLYQRMLGQPGADREPLTLALATALLDAGRTAEAEKALATLPEPHGPAWRLRAGLAAQQLNKRDEAQAAWDSIKEDELSPSDRAWYWFLAGALWDTARTPDRTKANEFYLKAEGAAPTELAKARFQLAAEQVRLRLQGVTSEADLRRGRENYETYRGQITGYGFAEALAVSYDLLGQKGEAVAFLQTVLAQLPRQEATYWDKLRLDLGLIGDRSRGGPGRPPLEELLENGHSPERQRQALQLLADASRTEPERGAFRAELDKLINATTRHPILESLLYYRAQQALADADYGRAERDANDLLAQFQTSPLRAHAYGVLTQSAWEQRRFRSVADNARKARAELPATATRPRFYLGVLDAEASYRAGTNAGESGQADFHSAADAYANVLREHPADLDARELGGLILQRVLAEIKSGSGDAPKLLDELKKDPAFDLENRWQAEWQLAQSLMLEGKIDAAYARVSGLLAEAPAGAAGELQPELRARMAWLQVRLAFESKRFAQSLTHADALLGAPPEITPELKGQILSDVILLKGQAELALGREPVALETLKLLRTEFPKSAAAVRSYMIEAAHNEGQGKIVDAMRGLTALVNNPDYKSSELVPDALFQLALLSESLGREENLKDANRRIEELVNSPAATGQTGLIFVARLKQGDIFRTLNDFPAARRAYEDLVNRYPRHPDVTVAMLRLAITEAAQATIDPSFGPKAAQKLEDLRERLDAPIDVRVQAGYMYGMLLRDSGDDAKAAAAWWLDVITPFLLKTDKPIEPGPRRAFWLAKTLIELADLQEKHGQLEDMKSTYQLLLKSNLGSGEGIAREKLQRYGVPTAAL